MSVYVSDHPLLGAQECISQPFTSAACRFATLHPVSTPQYSAGILSCSRARRGLRTSNGEGRAEAGAEEAPVLEGEVLALGVEGDVAPRALGVVVRRREPGARGVEGPTARQGGARPDGGAGEHLRTACQRWVGSIGMSRGGSDL